MTGVALVRLHSMWRCTVLLYWGAQVDVVRFLLEHGVDVNVPDRMGDTPSKLGSRRRHEEIVEMLSEYGAESVKM
jgi:ankyrin repeat protein